MLLTLDLQLLVYSRADQLRQTNERKAVVLRFAFSFSLDLFRRRRVTSLNLHRSRASGARYEPPAAASNLLPLQLSVIHGE